MLDAKIVVDMANNGYSMRQIAQTLNTTNNRGIRQILLKNGIEIPNRRNTKKYKNGHWSGYEDIYGSFWSSIVGSARKRKIKFEITIEEAWHVFQKQNGICALSGLPIGFATTCIGQIKGETTASLDRIDSTKGYHLDNVQWVHKHVNKMKSHYNQSYFIEICRKITERNIHG